MSSKRVRRLAVRSAEEAGKRSRNYSKAMMPLVNVLEKLATV